MQKKSLRRGSLQLPCGQAKPGAKLSSWGVNMALFCREFNARTSNQETGKPVMVRVEVFEDKSFSFEVKNVPTSKLLKDIVSNRSEKMISESELDYLANLKCADMNTENLENVKRNILGSMRSAGIVTEK